MSESEEVLRCCWKFEGKEKVWNSRLGRMGERAGWRNTVGFREVLSTTPLRSGVKLLS